MNDTKPKVDQYDNRLKGDFAFWLSLSPFVVLLVCVLLYVLIIVSALFWPRFASGLLREISRENGKLIQLTLLLVFPAASIGGAVLGASARATQGFDRGLAAVFCGVVRLAIWILCAATFGLLG